MPVIGLLKWMDVLDRAFGRDALFCLESLTQEEIDARLAAAAESTGDPDQDKGNQARAARWVLDSAGQALVLARRTDWKFFAVVMDDAGDYQQPITVEEPNPGGPCVPRNDTVGDISAMLAVGPYGRVYVKTVTVKRRVATGTDELVLEVDCSSTSRGQKLPGRSVGVGGFTNSARIRGRTSDLVAEAPSEDVDPAQGWMLVEEFVRTSPDRIGKSAVLTALVELGLAKFGRQPEGPLGP